MKDEDFIQQMINKLPAMKKDLARLSKELRKEFAQSSRVLEILDSIEAVDMNDIMKNPLGQIEILNKKLMTEITREERRRKDSAPKPREPKA